MQIWLRGVQFHTSLCVNVIGTKLITSTVLFWKSQNYFLFDLPTSHWWWGRGQSHFTGSEQATPPAGILIRLCVALSYITHLLILTLCSQHFSKGSLLYSSSFFSWLYFLHKCQRTKCLSSEKMMWNKQCCLLINHLFSCQQLQALQWFFNK